MAVGFKTNESDDKIINQGRILMSRRQGKMVTQKDFFLNLTRNYIKDNVDISHMGNPKSSNQPGEAADGI